jgi:hypothetical protein
MNPWKAVKLWWRRMNRLDLIQNDPDSLVIYIGFDRGPVRRFRENFPFWWEKHWQWAIGTALAVAGLIVGILAI